MLSRLRFYWVVATCGGVLMALEVLSSRVLAPHFGNSVYVWGSIISVFLAALSLGYLWGGRLADRHPSLAVLGRLIALAAFCQALVLLAGSHLVERIADLTGGSQAGPLLGATVLYGPASVLLATVSPYAVRLAARDLGQLGGTAGQLFALSTFGSLAGTLGCTFVLIPFLELRQSVALLTALTAATALVALAGEWRRQAPSVLLAALLIVFALPGASLKNRGHSDLLYERVTPYQTLQVRERGGIRYLESDRVLQAAVRASDGESAMPYSRSTPSAWLLNPEIQSSLMIGLGGGNVGRYLTERMPQLTIDYVDIDPAVPEVATRFLHFRETPRVRVTVADGRRFLHDSERKYDLIYCDAYIGLSVPFHLTTVEFLEEVKAHLEPGGVFGLNLAAGLSDPFSRAMYRTILDRFDGVYLFRVDQAPNVLIMATRDPLTLPPAGLAEIGRQLDRRYRLDPPLADLAARRVEVEIDTAGVPILTDELAPVDRLIRLGESKRQPLWQEPAAKPEAGKASPGQSR